MHLLWDYSFWAMERLLKSTERLADEQFRADLPLAGGSSIRQMLAHTLNAQAGWRAGLQGTPRTQIARVPDAAIPDAADFRSRWRAEETTMRDWLASLDDAALRADSPAELPLWRVLAHLANHSMQHRSEVAMALTHFGQSPGDLDLLFYMREQPR